MSTRLFDVIKAYWRNPGGYNLARGEELIAAGHLSPAEYDMLERAIRRYRERVEMTS